MLYCVTENNYSWFEYYLSNRKQCVVTNNSENRSFQNITCGVPKGPILSSLLFILYINDLKNADDSNLFISDKKVNTLFTKANLGLQKLNKWFKAKKNITLYKKNQCLPNTIKVLRKITCPWLTAQKMKFSIKDFPQETGDLITFTEEILNEKLHFLYSGSSNTKNRRRRAKKNLAQNP